jgi:putative transposase
MGTSRINASIRMIRLRGKARLSLVIDGHTRCAGQVEVCRADEAEFVICDQAIDITYIRLRHGWMYLVAVLNWYSRYIVSWAFADTLEIGFVLDAAQQALARATPQIWNTDQGSHFTSPQFTELVLASGARLSMDGKGRALDNIFTERLWRTIKYDHVFLHDWATPREARQSLGQFIHTYNERRLHQSLGYRTPAESYFTRAAA